jgi:hypothetical protein
MVPGERTKLAHRQGNRRQDFLCDFRARLVHVHMAERLIPISFVALNFDRTLSRLYFEIRVNMTGQIAHLI